MGLISTSLGPWVRWNSSKGHHLCNSIQMSLFSRSEHQFSRHKPFLNFKKAWKITAWVSSLSRECCLVRQKLDCIRDKMTKKTVSTIWSTWLCWIMFSHMLGLSSMNQTNRCSAYYNRVKRVCKHWTISNLKNSSHSFAMDNGAHLQFFPKLL